MIVDDDEIFAMFDDDNVIDRRVARNLGQQMLIAAEVDDPGLIGWLRQADQLIRYGGYEDEEDEPPRGGSA